jgi:hypothetical protein
MHDMMRLTMAVWWSLALVWLLAAPVGAEPGSDRGAPKIEAKGFGVNLEEAKSDALRDAVLKLRAQLPRRQIEHWQPTEDYIRLYLLDSPGRAGADEPLANGLKAATWHLTVKIPSPDVLEQLDRQAARRERGEFRTSMALRVVAGLALALVVLIGCIRADEWTRSRYTTWLRLAGASTFVAIVAGWLWLR